MTFYQAEAYVNRPVGDFYRTPYYVTQELLQREQFTGQVYDPACGDGAIVEVLRDYRINAAGNDIDRGFNFLETPGTYTNIVTNPPFRFATQFLERALETTQFKVCFFVRLAFLEGQRRRPILESSPLRTVYVFSERVSFTDKAGTMAFAWMVWEQGYDGLPAIKWI